MVEIVTGMTLGGYRLGLVLQSGDDGRKVFLAQDLAEDNRPVVVKLAPLPDQSGASRLNREFSILRQIACDGVVSALGYGVSLQRGIDYLILTAHGPSLAVVLAATQEQRLPTESALAMAYAAATSVGQLHAQGWCHGDLKPGNLLCDRHGKVLLSDIEFAIRLADRSLDQSGELQLAGTPPFMALELWSAGTQAKSAATDVWALGVTLYLALLGEYPFGHGDAEEIRAAIELGTPPRLDELPAPLRELLRLFLAVDPTERVTDGKQAAAAIVRTTTALGLYLAAGGRAFAEQVAAVPHDVAAPQADTSTIRPPVSVSTAATVTPPTHRNNLSPIVAGSGIEHPIQRACRAGIPRTATTAKSHFAGHRRGPDLRPDRSGHG